MENEKQLNEAVNELSKAIRSAISDCPNVMESMKTLRSMGFVPSIKMDVTLTEETADIDTMEVSDLELTEADIKALQRMKIRV